MIQFFNESYRILVTTTWLSSIDLLLKNIYSTVNTKYFAFKQNKLSMSDKNIYIYVYIKAFLSDWREFVV